MNLTVCLLFPICVLFVDAGEYSRVDLTKGRSAVLRIDLGKYVGFLFRKHRAVGFLRDRDDVGVTFQFFGNGDRGFLGLVIAYGYVQ